MESERFILTLKLEVYKLDSRGVLPAPADLSGWQHIFVDLIDDIDGLSVCTDNTHTDSQGKVFICGQHISQMEDSDWRIGSVEVVNS